MSVPRGGSTRESGSSTDPMPAPPLSRSTYVSPVMVSGTSLRLWSSYRTATGWSGETRAVVGETVTVKPPEAGCTPSGNVSVFEIARGRRARRFATGTSSARKTSVYVPGARPRGTASVAACGTFGERTG